MIDRYYIIIQSHENNCYPPHCAENRFHIFDRVSGILITKVYTAEKAKEIYNELSSEWIKYKNENRIAT